MLIGRSPTFSTKVQAIFFNISKADFFFLLRDCSSDHFCSGRQRNLLSRGITWKAGLVPFCREGEVKDSINYFVGENALLSSSPAPICVSTGLPCS